MKKKLLSLFVGIIIFALIFSSIGPNVAEAKDSAVSIKNLKVENYSSEFSLELMQDNDVKIVEDNEDYRIVETTENGEVIVTSYDKKANVLSIYKKDELSTLQKIDIGNIEYSSENFNITDLESLSENPIIKESPGFSTLASTLEEKTFSNFEYKITFSSPEKWVIRKPNPDSPFTKTISKTAYKQYPNTGALGVFRDVVNDINYYEKRMIGAIALASVIAIISTLISTINMGLTYVGVGAALGLVGVALDAANNLGRLYSNAFYWYGVVK